MRAISESDLRLWDDRLKRSKKVDLFDVSHGALSMHVGGFPGGQWELLFAGVSVEQREAAYLLACMSPDKFGELIRGYRLAKRAGLLVPSAHRESGQ